MTQKVSSNLGKSFTHVLDFTDSTLTWVSTRTSSSIAALSAYKTNVRKMPIDVAAKLSNLFEDGKWNQTVASKFFNVLALYSTKMWPEKYRSNPFAIIVRQRKEERERINLDEAAFEELLQGDNSTESTKWAKEMLQEIAIEMLLVIEVCAEKRINYVKLVSDMNKEMGEAV